jgi:hypothetical protein
MTRLTTEAANLKSFMVGSRESETCQRPLSALV